MENKKQRKPKEVPKNVNREASEGCCFTILNFFRRNR
jgi:hypothetical protein